MINARLSTFRRLAVVVAVAMLGLLVLPTPAHAAGSARKDGTKLVYTGGPERNTLALSYSGGEFTFYDSALSSVTAGVGCQPSVNNGAGFFPYVTCSAWGVDAIVIRTNGGDDVIEVEEDTRIPSGVKLIGALGDGADSWIGSRWSGDTVYGGPGNDWINTKGGNDRIDGDSGNDTLNGDTGNDRVLGDYGSDTLSGSAGNDVVDGGVGNDKVYGNTGRDTVIGGYGHDFVSGGLQADGIYGGAGNDRLLDDHRGVVRSSLSPDVLNGGYGRDIADYSYRQGEATRLWLSLDGRANDGASGEGDQILASVENLIGNDYSDVLIGSRGANFLQGRGGNDLVRGYGGNDRLNGDAGGDRLEGGPGNDTLDGWWGFDTLIGGTGGDALWGGVDGDLIYAKDRAADRVMCGGGVDRASVDSRDSYNWLCETVYR